MRHKRKPKTITLKTEREMIERRDEIAKELHGRCL